MHSRSLHILSLMTVIFGCGCHPPIWGDTDSETTMEPGESSSATSSVPTTTSLVSTTEETTGSTSTSTSTSTSDDSTAGSHGMSSNSSTGPDGICGDGAEQVGEDCDDGNMNNDDSCPNTCKTSCGDGVKQGKEACDDGINDGDYGGCNPGCTEAIRCGDGIVQPEYEHCEVSDDMNECETCFFVRRVFVLKTPVTGQISTTFNGIDLKGIAAADALCQEAGQNKISDKKKFKAWLSDKNSYPKNRFSAVESDVWKDTGHYKLVNGTLISEGGWDGLASDMHKGAINVTEDGITLPGQNQVWTSTSPTGEHVDEGDCASWTAVMLDRNTGLNATFGVIEKFETKGWTVDSALPPANAPCVNGLHLYCIEDP